MGVLFLLTLSVLSPEVDSPPPLTEQTQGIGFVVIKDANSGLNCLSNVRIPLCN